MKKKSTRPRGRPRSFDRDAALDRAITTFWAKGYNGASMDDLTKSMGISRPSLYATYGNKHDLFMATIDRYAETLGCKPMEAFFGERHITDAVAAFLDMGIRCVTAENEPKGCLIASVATVRAQEDAQVRGKLSVIFSEVERLITDGFVAAQDQGQLPQDANPQALASIVISISHSFAARARVGARPEDLSRMAKSFLAVLLPIRESKIG
jgi:AcrR family transcriptional regulator